MFLLVRNESVPLPSITTPRYERNIALVFEYLFYDVVGKRLPDSEDRFPVGRQAGRNSCRDANADI